MRLFTAMTVTATEWYVIEGVIENDTVSLPLKMKAMVLRIWSWRGSRSLHQSRSLNDPEWALRLWKISWIALK